MGVYSGNIYDFMKLLYLILVLLPLFILGLRYIKDNVKKLFFLVFTLGFSIYSGIGYGFKNGVTDFYLGYFTLFIYIFGLVFIFFSKTNLASNFDHKYANDRVLKLMGNRRSATFVISGYFLTYLIDLTVPEFKLHFILNPPAPDVISDLTSRFDAGTETSLINTLLRYVRTFLYPFFLIFITPMVKKNLKLFFFLLILPLYLEYCMHSYIGRSAVLINLALGTLLIYRVRTELRRRIVIVGISMLPVILLASYFYQYARVGATDLAKDINTSDALAAISQVEFGFPTLSDRVVKSSQEIDLSSYHLWIITLPIPKFGVFKVNGAYPAYEIAEIVTGVDRSQPNFNVVLSGYLTESIYVYGSYFFWINALVMGFFCAFFANLFSKIPAAYACALFLSLAYGYNFNRAGVQSALPLVTTYLVPFYFYVFFITQKIKIKI